MSELSDKKLNELCSCGSGNKYLKCCLIKASQKNVLDFSWYMLRQTESEIIDRYLLPYLNKAFPINHLLTSAWNDFTFSVRIPKDVHYRLYHKIFIPWLLFNWKPEKESSLYEILKGKTIVENYLMEFDEHLNGYQIRFIMAMLRSYYSFYVVLMVVAEERLYIKDILLKTEHHVKEKKGTRYLKRGDIIYARILTLDEQSIFVGMAPYTIPSLYHTMLIDYRMYLGKALK